MNRTPREAEALCDHSSQMGLVEVARGFGGAIERRPVEGREAALGPACKVGRDYVRMQLRIERAAHAVAVGRGDQAVAPLDALAAGTPADLHGGVLEVLKRCAQRP